MTSVSMRTCVPCKSAPTLLLQTALYNDMIHSVSRQESTFIMRKHSKDVCSAVGGCWHTFTLVCAGVGLSDFDCWHIDVQ